MININSRFWNIRNYIFWRLMTCLFYKILYQIIIRFKSLIRKTSKICWFFVKIGPKYFKKAFWIKNLQFSPTKCQTSLFVGDSHKKFQAHPFTKPILNLSRINNINDLHYINSLTFPYVLSTDDFSLSMRYKWLMNNVIVKKAKRQAKNTTIINKMIFTSIV